MVLVDALFIANDGGGPALLRYLIDTIKEHPNRGDFHFLLDERFKHDTTDLQVTIEKGSMWGRYLFYLANRHKYTKVFCFTNIPPLLKCKAPVYTYFHNQLILESRRHITEKKFSPFLIRYAFVRFFNRNTDFYIVQTKHMADDIVAKGLKKISHVLIMPFYQLMGTFASGNQKADHFAYVSNPSPHKNHLVLLRAWELLQENGFLPTLHLTVNETGASVLDEIKRLEAKGVRIVNHGYTDPLKVYGECAYCVYPSLNESFGLGLIEAEHAGLKIIAANLPYVRSVVEPSSVFDPNDPESIALSIQEALKGEVGETKIKVKNQVDDLVSLLLK